MRKITRILASLWFAFSWTVQVRAEEHTDQHLLDALSFVRDLPGIEIQLERRVEDVHSMVLRGDEVMPLFEGLGQRGWKVQMTGERLQAVKGPLVIYGKLLASKIELQVRPVSNSLDAEAPFDFRPLLVQLDQGQTVRLEVGPYRLTSLLKALGEVGWKARFTGDRVSGKRGRQKLEGTLEGSQAVLKSWTP